MNDNWLLASLFGALLPACAVGARLQAGAWLHPECFVLSCWSLFVLGPLLVAPEFPVSPLAVLWISGSVATVALGAFITSDRGKHRRVKRRVGYTIDIRVLRRVAVGAILLGLASWVVSVVPYASDTTIGSALNAVPGVAHDLSVRRYSDLEATPVLIQLLLSAQYLSGILGGLLFARRRTRTDLIVSVVTIAPVLLVSLTAATRAGLGFSLLLWLASYLSCCVGQDADLPRRSNERKRLAWATLALMLFVALSPVIDQLRLGTIPEFDWGPLATFRTKAAFVGHLAAFSEWFDGYVEAPTGPTLGAYTVAGPLSLLGITPRAQGLYTDMVYLSGNSTGTNIYSVWRGVLSDFTLVGSPFVALGVGMLGGLAYRSVRRGRDRFVPLLALYYSAVLCYVTSLFVYNSVVLAIVVGAGVWLYVVKIASFGSERKLIEPSAIRLPERNVQAMQQFIGQSPRDWNPPREWLGR